VAPIPTAIMTLIKLGPSTATIAIASSMPGKASSMSTTRMMTESVRLP
jgi:hypothetical protein